MNVVIATKYLLKTTGVIKTAESIFIITIM